MTVLQTLIGSCPYVAEVVEVGDRQKHFRDIKARAESVKSGCSWAPVVIGTKDMMEKAQVWWSSKKFGNGRALETSIVPAPMLRATVGSGRRPGIMPWAQKTMEEEFSAAFLLAYNTLKDAGRHELLPVIEQGEKLKLNTHGMRRGADDEAVELMAKSGATADDINMVFRWKLNEINRDMRLRYRGRAGIKLKLNVMRLF